MIQEILFTLRVLGLLSVAAIIVLALPYGVAGPALLLLARLAPALVGRRESDRALPAPARKGGVDLTKR